jgi:addiction module HigA family antidote
MTLPTHRRPTHPGEILEVDYRKELELTQQEMADRLGISRVRYVEIASGKRGITANTALRLERVFGTSAQTWLNLQGAVDLYDVAHGKDADDIAKLRKLQKKEEAFEPALEAAAV